MYILENIDIDIDIYKNFAYRTPLNQSHGKNFMIFSFDLIMVKETEGLAFEGNTICIMSVIFDQSA